ncbi:MAG: hypothetical protein GY744_13730 [Gammaproteobacteria bacterium]|nr:hypothetical protein [Gammaproteobacteria bacterium]
MNKDAVAVKCAKLRTLKSSKMHQCSAQTAENKKNCFKLKNALNIAMMFVINNK